MQKNPRVFEVIGAKVFSRVLAIMADAVQGSARNCSPRASSRHPRKCRGHNLLEE